jgi:hypothetical protein
VNAQLRAQLFHHQKQFVLAMEAAVRVVARVLRLVEFFGGNHFKRHAERLRKSARLLHVAPRQRGRIGQHRQHPFAQHAMRRAARNAESTPPE